MILIEIKELLQLIAVHCLNGIYITFTNNTYLFLIVKFKNLYEYNFKKKIKPLHYK